jgi:fructokinase
MRKIIAIGESILDTVYLNQQPVCSFVGGRVSNAAASLGELGLTVSMVSECCTDEVGDWVVDFFESHHVDTKSIDRYTDGSTPLAAIFKHESEQDRIVNYGVYPQERFNVIWPRIDEDDIVLFGSYYAIDTPQRERLYDLLSYAAERKAIVIYLPGFQHGTQFNLTKVMPNILENFEVSTLVVDHDKDINTMFPNQDSDKVYNNHIKFYGPTYIHITPDDNATIYKGIDKTVCPFTGSTSNHLEWQAGFIAGIIYEIIRCDLHQADISTLNPQVWKEIMNQAFEFAACCAANPGNCLSGDFAREKAQLLHNSNQ